MNNEVINKNIYIIRCGEVSLKGMNKPYFERILLERLKKAFKFNNFNDADIRWIDGLIIAEVPSIYDREEIIRAASKVFGVASVSYAIKTGKEIEEISNDAIIFMKNIMLKEDIKTFKVKAKRANKNYPIQSPEIARLIGGAILKGINSLSVDIHNPDCELHIDVRREGTYIYRNKVKAFGGLPLGTNGRGLLLMSGGIDSPVAAFMMAKRGMTIDAIHFHSYPYTSQRALDKVKMLVKQLSSYMGDINLHIVNLLPIQEEIVKNCPASEVTILVRRFMMRIAEIIAKKNEDMMLITGESLGQVASQTAEALVVTDSSVNIPVMRPLIAMDKVDIMDLAKEIGTYEISIEPYEDCCTVFLPKHPVTKPKLNYIENSESALKVQELINSAAESAELIKIGLK